MRHVSLVPLCVLTLAIACVPEEDVSGVAALGNGSHNVDEVNVDTILNEDDGLDEPRDLAWNPGAELELWVVNRGDDSVVRVTECGTDDQQSERRVDSFALHFMEEVSAISFSDDVTFGNGNTFATCQESNNTYTDQTDGNNFMGPTLWTSDWDIFGFANPDAVAEVGYDLGSHIDMMHESPFCMGIGWEKENIYWTVDGEAGTVSRYNFAADHGVGFDDLSDGTVQRFTEAKYTREEGIPSHIIYDGDDDVVYYNDTGAGRVMRLDPADAETGRDISSGSHDGAYFFEMSGADISTLVDGDDGELVHPSGLTLHDGTLYVTDNNTSRISAFDLDGKRIDYLDTELDEGTLMGIRVDDDGSIWVVDNLGNRVFRISAKDK